MRHFASAKSDRGSYFVASVQPAAGPLHSIVKIMIIGAGPEFDLFDLDGNLLFLSVVGLVLLFVKKLAVVDDLTNRRLAVWRYLDEI